MKRSPLVLLASIAAAASLSMSCGSRDLNAGSGPDGGNPDGGAGGPGDGSTPDGDAGGSGDGSTSDGGARTIASQIQQLPSSLVSDGTSLFWITTGGPIWSMPVGGGPITTVGQGMAQGGLLAVDDVNVYYLGVDGNIYRAPKNGGGSPATVSEPGAAIHGVTSLGGNAYWVERIGSDPTNAMVAVKSAALKGGPVGLVAEFHPGLGLTGGEPIGVTATTAFLSSLTGDVSFFPLASGVPDGGMPSTVAGMALGFGSKSFSSDTQDVYCETGSALFRLANDGTPTMLASVVNNSLGGGNVAIDDTYVYWADTGTVGTIMRVPKAGGAPSLLARDASPWAIAVDANAVYWADQGGNILRLDK
jgi:hypothetical protein